MSLLAPLYALGLLAISLPVVFHLIRRLPKGEVPFSSLMFLSPSPPRLTRRSRLEHLLLLLLRGLALALLAFAFARPFLRQTAPVDPSEGTSQRVAVVVDTSASMRREDLWQQAVAAVDAVLAERGPLDQVAVFTCDDSLRPLLGFEVMREIPPAQHRAAVRRRLAEIEPAWAGTQLGRGLLDAVEIVNNAAEGGSAAGDIARRVVLVSDMQAGGRLDVLADFPWPEDVRLELRTVKPAQTTNAGLQRLADRGTPEPGNDRQNVRVRVSNDAASAVDQFRLSWIGDDGQPIGASVDAYVPAGESRVVRVERPKNADATGRLLLSGDHCEFDNNLYLTARPQEEISVLYLGSEAGDDPQQLPYYLERALATGMTRPVELRSVTNDEPLVVDGAASVPLVVVGTEPTAEQTRGLKQYAEAGGTVLVVLTEGKSSAVLAALLDAGALDIEEADVDKYTMLGEIAFDHPLFAPMSGPQFNDFTQIHFWKYRRLKPEQLAGANIVARFENGDPAVVERRLGKGQVYVLASGWQPNDSQLARSWKFVLLLSSLVEGRDAGKADRAYFEVGEPVPLEGRDESAGELTVVKPNGERVLLAAGARVFSATDQPGLYAIESRGQDTQNAGDAEAADSAAKNAGNRETFVVNLDPAESQTSALPVEAVEQLGARLVSRTAVAENEQRQQLLRDVQMESRQKLWQWLIVAALAILVVETWVAGRVTKQALANTVSA